jgi:hypothetical protein
MTIKKKWKGKKIKMKGKILLGKDKSIFFPALVRGYYVVV